jgi:N-acetylneuraminate synthase
VRYHDFKEYISRIQPDIFEFHLSYSDMELNPDEFLSGTYTCGFVVHAPELFAGSRLMDLASPDAAYRAESIRETQRVIDITRDLKRFFPATARPMIVANIGGFTMDSPLDEMKLELEFIKREKSMDATIKQFSEWFVTGMSGLEYGSKNIQMMKAFGLQLDGLSEAAQMNVADLEDDFEE